MVYIRLNLNEFIYLKYNELIKKLILFKLKYIYILFCIFYFYKYLFDNCHIKKSKLLFWLH